MTNLVIGGTDAPPTLSENEFRISEAPPGSTLLVGEAAVFNVGGTFCATQAKCTYDNFARDFGERFVPGYKPASTVDYLLNSPFEE